MEKKLYMPTILTYHQINPSQWQNLIETSPTATWFQTPEAYQFYQSVSEMCPFAYGVAQEDKLVGVVVGYITQEKNPIKQFLTRRAIIIGGPLLADDINENALTKLLMIVVAMGNSPIYIETRNFHDYSRWKNVFEQCGWKYQPHLNFHVDTTTTEIIEQNLGKSRKRDIKTSLRDGATVVENPTIEQVRSYYVLLKNLYATKIKTPLFSLNFFENLYHHTNGHFVLIEKDNEIIGGTVCVELPNKCLYEWFVCGRDGEWKSIFPSSLATYAGICYAEKLNCKRFDMMGAGTPEEAYGVRDFKARFGGELVEHGRYLCIRKPILYNIGKLGVKLLKKR